MEIDPLVCARATIQDSMPPIINGCLSYARLRQGTS